ncbi:MAG: S8 family serine peptidase [Thermoplasmata archaeon]|nr:MAG: S8 family serine peptidase [Thermoplasmata archaeon]
MNKSGVSLLIIIMVIFPLLGSSGDIFADTPRSEVLDSGLLARLNRAGPDDTLEVIIQFRNEVSTDDLNLLSALNFDVGRTFSVIPAVYAIGTKNSIVRLSHYKRTSHIEFNEPLELLMDESTSTINATKVWASQIIDSRNRTKMDYDDLPLHIDGTGITIVVLDSGVDAGHPDLDYGEKTLRNLKSDMDGSYTEAENTDTSSGHGTHCAGTIAGNGDASGGARKGVAPAANLIGISTGEAVAILNALGALEWVYENSRPNANPFNIRGVSNSWGSSGEYNADNSINQVTRRIVNDNNVGVIFAAGNAGAENHDGSTVTTNPYSLEPSVISVAAMERDGSGVASFSSRGAANDNFTWPDIGAPGVHIWATEARKTLISAMRKQDPSDAQDGYYMSISGTSMATPHVSGLVALLFQAAPSLAVSEIPDDYQGEESEYWGNPDYTMHEVELIMKLTANYVPPSGEDNGVPSNFSIGLNNQPYDFAQGYGIIDAESAVALALTLEELRRGDPDTTVMDAYLWYHNITTNGTTSAETNVLATSWSGDWSQFTDPENLMSSFTTTHPRGVYVHDKTSRIIVTLAYDPISTSDMYSCTLTLVIDYDGDGSIDWRGDSSFSTEGLKIEEIDVGGGGGTTGQYWEFNVEGRALWSPTPKGFGAGENEFNEALVEYTVSVQMIFDMSGNETILYDSGDLHAKIAQPEFGEPTPEYSGNGSIEMRTYFYDLTKVYPKEAPPPKESEEFEFPWWILALAVILAGLLGYYLWQKKKAPKEDTVSSTPMEPETGQPEPQLTGEIVEAEVVSEPLSEPTTSES